ncbi:MAG: hypothetical protein ACLFQE_01960 [Thermotogota bacterium]
MFSQQNEEERIAIENYLEDMPEEEWSRYYFSQAIQNWGEAEYAKAHEMIEKTFEKPVYPRDIPKFWYFLAKLNIETGETKEAVESLNNVLLIEPDRTEILILLKVLEMLGKVDPEDNPILGLEYMNEILGFVDTYEFFYNPVASDVYNEAVYILDRANQFIFISEYGQNSTIELDMEAPSSIVIDKIAGRLYCSDLESGKVFVFDLFQNEIVDEFSGFKKPFVQTVDRLGNIYVLDPPNNRIAILSSTGKLIRYLYLSDGYTINIVNDVDVSFDHIIMQDLSARAFRIIRTDSFEEQSRMPFRENSLAVCSTVGPDGVILTVWDDGVLTYHTMNEDSDYRIIDTTNIELTGVSDIDYNCPVLTVTDFDTNRVRMYTIVQEKPMAFVNIDAVEANLNELEIQFRALDNMGKRFQFVRPFLNVIDSGGNVPYRLDTVPSTVNFLEIEDGEQFFEEDFKRLLKTEYNIVLWKYDGYDFNFANIAPALFSKNVSIYVLTNVSVPEQVKTLAKLTGGMVINTEMESFLREYFTNLKTILTPKVNYNLSLPFEGIKTVSVSLRIAGLDYSDSIYYALYMIPYFTQRLE